MNLDLPGDRQGPLTPQQRLNRNTDNMKAVVIVAAIVAVLYLWTTGMFDNALYKVHLNHDTCGMNGFGAVYCGKALNEYNARINKVLNP